jgi:hypothetical protein
MVITIVGEQKPSNRPIPFPNLGKGSLFYDGTDMACNPAGNG